MLLALGGSLFKRTSLKPQGQTTVSPYAEPTLSAFAYTIELRLYSFRVFCLAEPDMPELFDRITINPTVRSGKPVIRGTRITVSDVLEYLASGMSESEILADFPDLSHEDILATLAFAAQREQRLFSAK